MIWIFLVIIGIVGFSISAGNYIYKSKFKRSNFERNSFVNNESHVKDQKVMNTLLKKKQQWIEKKRERNIECITIKGFAKNNIKNEVSILHGELWLADSRNLSTVSKNSKSSFIVIIVHGFSDSSDGMGYLCEEYHKLNFSVISINLRAHGQSSGEYPGLGYLDAEDLNLWIDYIINRFDKDIKILVHGVSMGAGTILQTFFSKNAWNENKCKIVGAIADSSFCCFKNQMIFQIQKSLGDSRLQKVIGTMIYYGCSLSCYMHAGFFIGNSSPIKKIKKFALESNDKIEIIDKPFLILFQGTEDTLVYPENADLLYLTAQKKGVTKNSLVKIEKAPHIGSYFYDSEKYMNTIIQELKKL